MEPTETSKKDLAAGGIIVKVPTPPEASSVLDNGPIDDSIEREDPSAAPTAYVVPFHLHNDQDSPRIRQEDIARRSDPISATLPGTSAATAANYGVFFIAIRKCVVKQVYEFHTTKGTDASAVTLNIEKLTGTQAPDAGVTLLSTAFDLKGNINARQVGALVALRSSLTLKPGDRLCLKDAGTLTAVAGVIVGLEIEYLIK